MSRFWPYYFLLFVVEGLVALSALLIIPGESLSLARLALILSILLPTIFSVFLLFLSRDAEWCARWLDVAVRPRFWNVLIVTAMLLFVTFGLFLFLLRYLNPEATASYYVRARPVLTYFLLIAGQSLLWLIALRYGIHFPSLQTRRTVLLSAVVVFFIFIAIWAFILVTGLGITKDTSYWGEPGVPVLGWQFVLALFVGFCFLLYFLRFSSSPRAGFLIPATIWLLAIVLWMSIPISVLRSSFYAPITPPYNQPFPASDAAYYDANAQSLLMGYGFVSPIPTRPLFILFLSGLHTLFGQEYARLVLGQTLIYALLPVALYFLGKKLYSRTAGVVVALLAIFREMTSLWIASDARVSNTKMLLSEFITTLILIAYLLLLVRWLREKRKGYFWAFCSGGTLGLQLLLRTQAAFLAPGILLLAFFAFWPNWKRWFAQSVVFALGLALAISPWVVRNYTITGYASLDDPAQIKSIASMYSGGTPTSNYSLFEGQTPDQMSAFVVDTILNRPAYVAGFVSNQFFANSIDTLLVLPIFARYDGLLAPIHLYWYEWDGHLSSANVILFVIYLGVIALGIAAAWKRLRWVSLIPLVFFVSYNFSTSLARYSGWRYIFPADWVAYFYFAIGVAEIFSILVVLFGADASRAFPEASSNLETSSTRGWKFAAWAGLFLFIGSIPWIVESNIPRVELYCMAPTPGCSHILGVNDAQLKAFFLQPDTIMVSGRALYPRYFSRNNGLASTNPVPAYAPRNFPRMGFYLLEDGHVEQVVLPMKGSHSFPNAQDAVVLGCWRDTYLEARLVVFPATGEQFTSGSLDEPCMLP